MATSTPFVHVTVNRFGFNVLDVKINLVNTEEPRKTAVMLVALTCGIQLDDKENIDWLESQYNQSITNHANVNPIHTTFYVCDDLINFVYEVEKDR
jgi:hypothetical protein